MLAAIGRRVGWPGNLGATRMHPLRTFQVPLSAVAPPKALQVVIADETDCEPRVVQDAGAAAGPCCDLGG